MKKSLFILLTMVALVFAACEPVQPAADGEAGPQEYVLGVAQPFTGSLGSFGTDFGKGIELAVDADER